MDALSPRERDNARYFVSFGPAVTIVHILGDAGFGNCRALARFFERHVATMRKSRLYINLADCSGMDSTVAGLIAACAFDLSGCGPALRVALVSPSVRVREMLMNLGLAHIVDFENDPPAGISQVMDSLGHYANAFGACPANVIFRAHEALVALEESNVERFADVFAALREDPTMRWDSSVDHAAAASSRSVAGAV